MRVRLPSAVWVAERLWDVLDVDVGVVQARRWVWFEKTGGSVGASWAAGKRLDYSPLNARPG